MGVGWRRIQHLSYPQGDSINTFIDSEFSTVQYTSIDKVLSTISEIVNGALLARMDVKTAFLLLMNSICLVSNLKDSSFLTNVFRWVVSHPVLCLKNFLHFLNEQLNL